MTVTTRCTTETCGSVKYFDLTPLAFAKLRTVEDFQAESDGGGIQRVELVLERESVARSLLQAAPVQAVKPDFVPINGD